MKRGDFITVAMQGNGHKIAAFHSSSVHPPSLHFC